MLLKASEFSNEYVIAYNNLNQSNDVALLIELATSALTSGPGPIDALVDEEVEGMDAREAV